MPPLRLLVPLVVLVCVSVPPAEARSWSVFFGMEGRPVMGGGPTTGSATAGTNVAPTARLGAFDLRVGEVTFDVGAGVMGGSGTAAAGWRWTLAAGPIGTLLVEGRAGVDASGLGAAIGARGTAGPVALRVELQAGTRPPAPFVVLARTPSPGSITADGARLSGAPPGGWRFDASAAATWRPDRRWTVELAPRLHLGAAGWAGGTVVSLRRSGVATDVDLSARADVAMGAAARHTLLGLTVHHVPRRAPESRVTVWWGLATATSGPGIEVAWVAREGAAQVGVGGGWLAAWADRSPSYLEATLQAPALDGTGHLGVRWVSGSGVTLEVGWARTVDR